MTKKDVIHCIEQDPWMMNILRVVQKLNLPDWWIGAGFVRSKVWDVLHGYDIRTPLPDIDVIYFDRNDFTQKEISQDTTKKEVHYEKLLNKQLPDINWSVTNQARMHLFHNDKPYKSSEEALSHWVETATCVGVRLDNNDNVVLTSPHGIDDLVHLIIRPTPGSYNDLTVFHNRIKKKMWLQKWPRLKVVTQ